MTKIYESIWRNPETGREIIVSRGSKAHVARIAQQAQMVPFTIREFFAEYEIYVDYKFGACETYVVTARNLAEAKKKAKARFVREYFKKSYLKATKSS